jgi:hypothetical protein
MKINTARKNLLIGVIFSFSLFSEGCKVEIDTKIMLDGKNNPPKFKMSGTGTTPIFMVGGPYPSKNDSSAELRLWEITTDQSLASTPIWRLDHITYGALPTGFIQNLPKEGQPKPLEVGKRYCIFTHVYGARPGYMCFEIKNNIAIEAEE